MVGFSGVNLVMAFKFVSLGWTPHLDTRWAK